MLFGLIHMGVYEVEQVDEVMGGGGSFESTVIGRVNVGSNDWHYPISKEGLA